ncbi:DUF2242 domain-containing protein [Paraburkholderia sp. DHOC27]|uniref:DUF2242 domain-containing protein n=1 Tax=Paraburkholderia sp. DHOC27 TaxID=2303330 RepID=UPI000E3C5AF6|nr:DUF2242 domain-containing protein [Paraburkholderia sp. DHOC27]RFU43734.1 DUF2242 domain-containing protein [Paraburkholderia sp. DHOC27]
MRTLLSKATAASLLGLAALAACSSAPQPKFQQELFDTGASPFARNFNASTTDTCEAARRALLSQGYMTTLTHPDTVDGTKNFQPTGDSHVVVEFHVVCTAGEETSDTSIVYVNAVQNGYALKKSDTSASVGLSVLGSVSLPIRSNSDEMVKISSETIPSGKFYDRFFSLVDHYLQTVVRTTPVTNSNVVTTPLPVPLAVVTPAPAAVPVPAPAGALVVTTSTAGPAVAVPVVPAAVQAPAPMLAPASASSSGPAAAITKTTTPTVVNLGAPVLSTATATPPAQAAASQPASGAGISQ